MKNELASAIGLPNEAVRNHEIHDLVKYGRMKISVRTPSYEICYL